MSILSLNTSSSYNKCFLAKKLLQRDVGCNYKGGSKAVRAHLQRHPAAGFLSRSWLGLQPRLDAERLPGCGLSREMPCSRCRRWATGAASSCLAGGVKTQTENRI